ncbi:MAG: hypothetical protein N4A49_09180 [Marinifilaceae bacterium]|jgi:hypothetical protein|nr:hypothetical protein [Marinifilaceae bacterium]
MENLDFNREQVENSLFNNIMKLLNHATINVNDAEKITNVLFKIINKTQVEEDSIEEEDNPSTKALIELCNRIIEDIHYIFACIDESNKNQLTHLGNLDKYITNIKNKLQQ